MKNRTHYQVLEVSEDASLEAIRKAYKLKALKFHPDKNKDAGAEEEFKAIANAHEALSDANKRRQYDLELRQQRAAQNKPKVSHQAETPKPAPQAHPAQTKPHTWTRPEATQKPATARPTHFAQPAQHRAAKPANTSKPSPAVKTARPVTAQPASRPAARQADAQLFVLMMLLQMDMMRQVQLQIAMQLIIRDVLAAQLDHIYKAQYAVRHNKNNIETGPVYTSPGIRAR